MKLLKYGMNSIDRKEKFMKTMYTITRRDDAMNDYCFETMAEAIRHCEENELDNDTYRIDKILEDENGCEAECLAIYSVTGDEE
jgi:hypothetical protein